MWGFPLRIETVLSESNTKESLKTTEPLLPYLSFYTHKSLSPLLHYATVDICTCPNLQTDGIPTPFLIYISSWPCKFLPLITLQVLRCLPYLSSLLLCNIYKHIRATLLKYHDFLKISSFRGSNSPKFFFLVASGRSHNNLMIPLSLFCYFHDYFILLSLKHSGPFQIFPYLLLVQFAYCGMVSEDT